MAYSDPITMAAAGPIPVKVLARVPSAKPQTTGLYRTADGLADLQVRQNSTRNRKRRELVLTVRKIATDPFTAKVSEISASVSVVFDSPNAGFTNQELKDMESHVRSWIGADTSVRDKLLGGEL